MFAISSGELAKKPVFKSQFVRCPTCGKRHKVSPAVDMKTGEQTALLFYRCPKTKASYLAALNGKSLMEEN
jgi:hypothetical protein